MKWRSKLMVMIIWKLKSCLMKVNFKNVFGKVEGMFVWIYIVNVEILNKVVSVCFIKIL